MKGSTVYESLEDLVKVLGDSKDCKYLLEDIKERLEKALGERKPYCVSWVSTETDYATATAMSLLVDSREGDTWVSEEGEEFYKLINAVDETLIVIEMNIPGMSDYLLVTYI